jgi:hypothetical protein
MPVRHDSAPIVRTRRRRLAVISALLVFVALLFADWSQDPQKQHTGPAAIRLISVYQAVSAHLHAIVRCPYTETCSRYARRMIHEKGFPRA